MISRFLLATCFLGLFFTASDAANLTVTVENLRNNQGQVLFCVFAADSANKTEFPDCTAGRAVKSVQAPISGGKAVMTFKGLKDGEYAIAIIHDENTNGKLDTNFIGIPAEGVGVSTNPRVFGKPDFEQGQFSLKGDAAITIVTKYIL
jgi:uncharacterized protein (DUF2141 family)